MGAACEHIGHGLTYKRRWIVKQPQESALGGGAIFIGQLGNQPGSRQRSRCLCSPAGRSGSYPTDELPTIMVLPTNATKNDTMAHGHCQRK
jgi:hypothetical protein